MAAETPLRVVLIGSDFEVRVLEALLKIPVGLRDHLFRCRTPHRAPECRARGRRGGPKEPDLVRGPVPPRARTLGSAYATIGA